jgi:hypothetical protein
MNNPSKFTMCVDTQIPHYKDYFRYDDLEIGRPFCLDTAVRIYGKEIVPSTQGIYHLFYHGILVYIGMSKNLRKRLLYHAKDDDMVFDAVLWFSMPDYSIANILEKEAKMIKQFRPSLNTAQLCCN